MTRKEQIAKKAARAAALATYKAILTPPVWKVAGTSFTTSPTWDDIAKAAAAASYSAVLKMAEAENIVIKEPLVVTGPKKDVNHVLMTQPAVDWKNVANALQLQAKPLYDWIVSGAAGEIPVPAQVAAKEFANWVKTPMPGKMNWATAERYPEIVDAICSNSDNPKLRAYLLSL
jgi:hypothetical protein